MEKNAISKGDILVASWGYDQTNVDFYLCVSRTAKTVELAKIGKTVVACNGSYSLVVPNPEAVLRASTGFRRKDLGGFVKVNSYTSAGLWDGGPVYETAPGYGH